MAGADSRAWARRAAAAQNETVIWGRPACLPMGRRYLIGLFVIGYAPFLVADIALDDIHMATGIGFICLCCTIYVCSWYEESVERRRGGRQAEERQA